MNTSRKLALLYQELDQLNQRIDHINEQIGVVSDLPLGTVVQQHSADVIPFKAREDNRNVKSN